MYLMNFRSDRKSGMRERGNSTGRLLPGLGAWFFALALSAFAAEETAIGTTRIARWKGDRTAAFLLMFDDSWPSHFQVAAPALAARGMTATFYINPGKGEYRKFAGEWETNVWRQGMAYGNHTFAHASVTNAAQAEQVIAACNDEILRIVPGPVPRLISYGQPGVKEWRVTPDEMKPLLANHHLIDRPPFKDHGAVYHWKTVGEMLALADKAIATQGLEYLVIHGVERIKPAWSYQDFWALKQEVFFPLLDGLKQRQDQGKLWITDHITAHRYETERASATVTVERATPQELRLTLTCSADTQLYDEPLTLITKVPAHWKSCVLSKTNTNVTLTVTQGSVRYDAQPDGNAITLKQNEQRQTSNAER
jgi:peptidoglycan/xylan/chitin deacetylase (PgdA/CDA1 family)